VVILQRAIGQDVLYRIFIFPQRSRSYRDLPFTFDNFLVIVAELCRFGFAVYQGSLFLVL
jgi:hypothetical protein